jgi:hypothetical protein
MNRRGLRSFRCGELAVFPMVALFACACGGGSAPGPASQPVEVRPRVAGADGGFDDHARCEFRGRLDRETVETAGPGAVQPNVRRVYQMVGTGESVHKIIICREIDSNLDGIKDILRTYNDKGESLHEEADANYDGRVDTWITFSGGRMAKEDLDTDFDGNPDVWKYYVGGQLSRIQRDTNRDGKPDRWEFYTAGKLERVGSDLDFDGHVDRWDHDEIARQAAEAEEKASSQAKAVSATADAGASTPAAGADGGAASLSKRKKK